MVNGLMYEHLWEIEFFSRTSGSINHSGIFQNIVGKNPRQEYKFNYTHVSRRPWICPKSEKRRKRETRKNNRLNKAIPTRGVLQSIAVKRTWTTDSHAGTCAMCFKYKCGIPTVRFFSTSTFFLILGAIRSQNEFFSHVIALS